MGGAATRPKVPTITMLPTLISPATVSGRVKLLGISKRGDTHLRTLLIHGARSVLTNSKALPSWVTNLRQRRPPNVAVVAMANKMACMLWALLAHQRTY